MGLPSPTGTAPTGGSNGVDVVGEPSADASVDRIVGARLGPERPG